MPPVTVCLMDMRVISVCLANVFGCRWPAIAATALFKFGRGLCGCANGISMLIAIGAAMEPFFGGLIVDHTK
jgi:hypothetical protein